MNPEHAIRPWVRFRGELNIEAGDEAHSRNVAEFLAAGLRKRGLVVSDLTSDETWSTVSVVCGGADYVLMIAPSLAEQEGWDVVCRRIQNLLTRLPDKSENIDLRRLRAGLDDLLRKTSTVHDITWYSDYDFLDGSEGGLIARGLNAIGKYLPKFTFPLLAIGLAMVLIGVLLQDNGDLLLRVGAAMFAAAAIVHAVMFLVLFLLNLAMTVWSWARRQIVK